MRQTWTLLALLLSTAAVAAAPDLRSLVGAPLPEPGTGAWKGWERLDVWTVEEDPASTGAAFSWTVWTRTGEAALFLQQGERVSDALRIHLLEDSQVATNCRTAGAPRSTREIVAVVPESPGQQGPRCPPASARAAWRLDRSRGRIEPIPAEGVTCQPPCPWD